MASLPVVECTSSLFPPGCRQRERMGTGDCAEREIIALFNTCSTMRGRIKGTDSTINTILATAVLYELRWKIWNCAGKIQFVIKTVMTNTVEITEWSELLNRATNQVYTTMCNV